jgi:Uma2 family endonuclease
MATTPTRLMTLAEYEQVPNPPGGVWELYHGELVKVGFAKIPHANAQTQIRELVRVAAGDQWLVREEMAFCPLPEHECWAADVGLVSKERWKNSEDWLEGAPELVVEVISPSNSLPKLLDKARICLENGCVQFWIVNLRHRRVRALTSHSDVTYHSGQRLPLFFGGEILVGDIFQ